MGPGLKFVLAPKELYCGDGTKPIPISTEDIGIHKKDMPL